MQIRKRFRNQLFLVYFLSILLGLLGGGTLLINQWNDSIKDAGTLAVKNLELISSNVRPILSNGSKLLDVTKKELQQLIVANQYNPKSIEKVISSSASIFSIDNQVENYGILTVNDKEGNLVSRSDRQSTGEINFSDRYYFKELQKDPNKNFSIGPLLVARTTGRRIFSIAVPIKDSQGNFNGTLALQISEDSITKTIKRQVEGSSQNITALTANKEIIFTNLSSQIHPDSNRMINFAEIYGNINLGTNDEWIKSANMIVATHITPELQITYVSVEPIQQIFSVFLKSNIGIFVLGTISFLIFSFLMRFIYLQYLQAEHSRIDSSTDQLTQLPNRRAFDERYESFLRDAQRNNSDISVLFIDIDKFKFCNDQYGHENGDLVLIALANILKTSMRRPFDFCCRWGGEELVALLPDTSESGAAEVAGKILDTVRKTPISIKNHPPIHMTVSIGIASAHYSQQNGGHLENNLVDRADQAMYRAKQGGRDRYSL